MPLETKDIEKLAKLSRLQFAPERLPGFVAEFENILTFVGQISALDTKGVAPLTTTSTLDSTPERADVVTATNRREALQATAPAKEMGFFVVPRVVE